MWRNAQQTYLEERVLSADPVELIGLLYQAALTAVGDAQRHLASGQILPRSQAISKACDILTELNTSLDHQRGGEISQQLAQLYGYMHCRLVDGNCQKSSDALAEVADLLTTLADAWSGVGARISRPPAATAWMPAFSAEPELAHSGGWSF